MSITIEELRLSRPLRGGLPEIHIKASGSADQFAVRDAIFAHALVPEELDGGLFLRSPAIDLEPRKVDPQRPDRMVWEGVVRYEVVDEITIPSQGTSIYSFDVGSGQQHIAVSLATVNAYPAPDTTAPNFEGAINVTDRGVEGASIVVPVARFGETHWIAAENITTAYIDQLEAVVGTVNNATFKGRPAGEVLFVGASGSRRANENVWEVSYQFARSVNLTNITLGPITGIDKDGWDYLWVRYTEEVDEAADALVRIPQAVYIERVYERTNFALIGIGTT